MGVVTPLDGAVVRPDVRVPVLTRLIPPVLRSETAYRRFALWAVITNVIIVVSGGAVRLTDSGLGCPTFPRCTDATLTPTKAYGIHGIIEFSNRQLTFVVAFFAIACWLIALARRQERLLATLLALSIPLQALLGGITVLTHLNPWAVGSHFMVSVVILFVAFWLWWRVRDSEAAVSVPAPAQALARLTALITVVVLVFGTIVTGAGPHAGDKDASGKVHRNGLKVSSMAQLHADSVWILVGATVGLVAVFYAVHAADRVRRAALLLLGVELGQGVIGYVQYFLHVPPLLVGLHMLGACLLWLAVLYVLAQLEPRAVRKPSAVTLRTG
ncbi:MAG TPA: COX15/CtaA family protein [Jatrophihabitantaceae bacterium]|nr:COX15/CtaA family protein [Jatrophihabitantaceae bacterium]